MYCKKEESAFENKRIVPVWDNPKHAPIAPVINKHCVSKCVSPDGTFPAWEDPGRVN
jgi:hypothetical protein